MIDFEIEPSVVKRVQMFHMVADGVMRPISREYDEKEHEEPEQYFQTMWAANAMADSSLDLAKKKESKDESAIALAAHMVWKYCSGSSCSFSSNSREIGRITPSATI